MCPAIFNPHSPCGERLCLRLSLWDTFRFSIHTPHAGSDASSQIFASVLSSFQSTLPMRGATANARQVWQCRIQFSIHTPHAGSDQIQFRQTCLRWCFQSTLPMRGATRKALSCVKGYTFQSTLPMRGATAGSCAENADTDQFSIHTPHAGSDRSGNIRDGDVQFFNPHSPCGERQKTIVDREISLLFQSTLPMRGATYIQTFNSTAVGFSIHTPHAGSDSLLSQRYSRSILFNPHSPCGERPAEFWLCWKVFCIFNPHSPCGERPAITAAARVQIIFNPHSPCGERRRQ